MSNQNKSRQEHMWAEAAAFIKQFHAEQGAKPAVSGAGKSEGAISASCARRLDEVARELATRGTYTHTDEELVFGAKLAWRNSNRCIGRLFWEALQVRDARAAATEAEVAEALLAHIAEATNGGKIRPLVTIFRDSSAGEPIRIWNHQLIRYAGYRTENAMSSTNSMSSMSSMSSNSVNSMNSMNSTNSLSGTHDTDGIIGDPASVAFTAWCQSLGWQGEGTRFDVLPLVVQIGNRPPRWFEIPRALVLEVPLTHPTLPAFAELDLRWYAVPIVSDMRLEIGGLHYTAAPFNGWYMGTEIGARNLADVDRYDQLPAVADVMGLDRTSESTLWRDRALVELNVAVLHAFKQHGVSIVDHHTAAQQFKRFEEREAANGRAVTGRWSWLIPPLSPATTHVFHSSYEDRIVKPNFFAQDHLGETVGP